MAWRFVLLGVDVNGVIADGRRGEKAFAVLGRSVTMYTRQAVYIVHKKYTPIRMSLILLVVCPTDLPRTLPKCEVFATGRTSPLDSALLPHSRHCRRSPPLS